MRDRLSSTVFYAHAPEMCGGLVALGSAAILAGWWFRISVLRTPFPTGHPITPWGALLFFLLGISLILCTRIVPGSRLRAFGVAACIFVLAHSVLTIIEYASGFDLGFDAIFMRSRVMEWWVSPGPPGRYALNAAIAFAGIALGILLRGRRVFQARLNEVFSVAVGVIALLGLVGYLYGVHELSGLGQKVWMARNGAILFGMLVFGTFFLECDYGLARLVTARHTGGVMARRLLLTSVISLLLLGWVATWAVQSYLTSLEVAVGSLVVAGILVTVLLIFSTAHKLDSMEQARQRDSLALQQSSQRLQVATDAAELGIWIWDPEKKAMFASEKTKQLLGIPDLQEWFEADAVMSRVYDADRDKIYENGLTLRLHADFVTEFRVALPEGGTRWLAARGRRLRNGSDLPHVFGVVWDITDQRRAEDALIRNEKLASVARMAASIAHEVNNPLAAAVNLLFLSLSDKTLNPSTRQFLLTMEIELDRIAHITRQTLGFYREQLRPGQVCLRELAAEVASLYQLRAEQKNIALHLRVRPVPAVFGNAGEIRQVLSNLVANAIDAMPHGGALHIRVGRIGTNVRITIADTGAGIAPANLEHIFEAFFTTKENTGTGLGLWTSRQIVERHKGVIGVRSHIGKGTVFSVVLPISEDRQAAAGS